MIQPSNALSAGKAIGHVNATRWTGLLVFCLTFVVFRISPVHQVTDSKYSMMLSQSLLDHHSFILDRYALPLQPVRHGDHFMSGESYQLEVIAGHLFYYFPPGSSILSMPYVAFMNLFGISAVRPDGTHNEASEIKIQVGLARLLMAAFAVVAFYAARLLLPLGWSVVIALGGALGTPIYSTASRGLWSDTWGVLLLGISLFLLLSQELGKRRVSPVLLATLSAWMYFVRPTYCWHIALLTGYLFFFYRGLFVRYVLTGAFWLAGFLCYSWSNFGTLLPNYYRASRLVFDVLGTALAGNLISPSRGLLVYIPVLLFVAFILVRYRRSLAFPRLALLAVVVIAGHWFLTSCFRHWWGGMSFGARFMTGLVPWFVLLSILGVRAMLDWRKNQASQLSFSSGRIPIVTGAFLLALSCFINARGAFSLSTQQWNSVEDPRKFWDWKEIQFLAGLFPPPLPSEFPRLTTTHLDFLTPEAEQFLFSGWSGREPTNRWSDGHKALIIFALDDITDTTLRIKLGPFLVPGRLTAQKVLIALNGHGIGDLALTEGASLIHSLVLPKSLLRSKNILTFKLPNAASPVSFALSPDPRLLGIHVDWIELQPNVADK